jgi:hypothetical protein
LEIVVDATCVYRAVVERLLCPNSTWMIRIPGKYVDSYAYPEGRLEFRWKGVSLPYSVFDKDQRVTHAAITENKHLSAVLEHIKTEQEKAPPKNVGPGNSALATSQPGAETTAGIPSPPVAKRRPAKPARAAIFQVSTMAGFAPLSARVGHFQSLTSSSQGQQSERGRK